MNRLFYTASVILLVVLGGCDKGKDLPSAEKLALFKAVEAGDAEMLRQALGKGVSPNLYHSERGYLITAALMAKNNVQLLKILIDAGADVNIKKGGNEGEWAGGTAPIIDPILSGDCEATRLLLRAGANPNEVFTRQQAAAAAAGHEYFDKTARKLYMMSKQKSFHSPVNAWEKNKTCWLEVERLMK